MFLRAFLIVVVTAWPAISQTQRPVGTWLDNPRPASWNSSGLRIPTAPKPEGSVDARCRDQVRPPQLDEDQRVHEQGWDLIGAYQGGWQMLAMLGAASYDGMCRPRRFQAFVFVRGAFAGTLSPELMDSRSDGALTRIFLQGQSRLTADYVRYSGTDPLCCPSRVTTVVFDIPSDVRVVRPVSASTTTR